MAPSDKLRANLYHRPLQCIDLEALWFGSPSAPLSSKKILFEKSSSHPAEFHRKVRALKFFRQHLSKTFYAVFLPLICHSHVYVMCEWVGKKGEHVSDAFPVKKKKRKSQLWHKTQLSVVWLRWEKNKFRSLSCDSFLSEWLLIQNQ